MFETQIFGIAARTSDGSRETIAFLFDWPESIQRALNSKFYVSAEEFQIINGPWL
jgi:hypothetical protein